MKSSGSIVLTLLALAVLKYIRSCSAEQFLRTYFIYAKITIFARALFIDQAFAFLHLVAFSIIYLFAQYPSYLGISSEMIPIKSQEQFKEAVSKFKRSSKRDESVLTFKHTNMQFVEFYRDNEQLCNDTRALWAEFAEKYSTPKFKFYSVNVNKIRGLAEQFDIDTKPESAEFPTVILFEEGEIRLRYPVDDGNTYIGKQMKSFKKKAFEKYFGFHNRWFDTKDESEKEQQQIEIKQKDKVA